MRGSSFFILVVCLGVNVFSGCAKYEGEFLEEECVNDADCPEGYHCNPILERCQRDCVPDCDGKCCGPDGCGGVCPDDCTGKESCDRDTCRCGEARECETNDDCPKDYWCDRTDWRCRRIECIPNCTGKCCGPDGCNGTCPDYCPQGYYCHLASCECRRGGCITDADCRATQCCIQGSCTNMQCGAFECGPDPVCGKECGPCPHGYHCDQGTCVRDVFCAADADCMATQCCMNGVCVDMACGVLECGPDPVCGMECGPCAAGWICRTGQCVVDGDGLPGDPCTFDTVNASAGNCRAGLECLGVPADGAAGTCPGGSPSECTDLMEEWNIDCVGGNCGVSFCSQVCDADRWCPPGYIDVDIGEPPICFCIPYRSGDGAPGDPCPWGDVNTEYAECSAGLACLGNDDIGLCPGGTLAECTAEVPYSYNPDCVDGICGFSFCSEECDAQGNCPAGFIPADVSGTCFCIPT